MTITNEANGNTCVLKSLPASGTLKLNSFTGGVYTSSGLDYANHDKGFIRLEPCQAVNVIAGWTSGSDVVSLHGTTTDAGWVGRYIYVDGGWKKIISVPSTSTVQVASAVSSTSRQPTKIAVMNRITITGTSITLTTFTFDYTPLLTV